MPRPKGSKVIKCECGGRVVGMPQQTVTCPFCNKPHTIPKKKQKDEDHAANHRRG